MGLLAVRLYPTPHNPASGGKYSRGVKKGQGIGEAGSIQALESLRYLLVVQPSSVSVENGQPHFPKTVRFRLVV